MHAYIYMCRVRRLHERRACGEVIGGCGGVTGGGELTDKGAGKGSDKKQDSFKPRQPPLFVDHSVTSCWAGLWLASGWPVAGLGWPGLAWAGMGWHGLA